MRGLRTRSCRTASNLLIFLCLVFLCPAAFLVQEGWADSWIYTEHLNTARGGHTATLLEDGRVLVAGGSDEVNSLSSCEIYDPATGKWSKTGSMRQRRWGHTATLLADGRVLVTGGYYGAYPSEFFLSSAELYDPETGTWSNTGSMHSRRVGHTATLLQNGEVLVTGGFAGNKRTRSAEVYRPSKGTWIAKNAMIEPRNYHAAVLLPDGRVLVGGGKIDDDNLTKNAEIFDRLKNTWTPAGKMLGEYWDFTFTLLSSGKVLAVGQDTDACLYTPKAKTWSTVGAQSSPRWGAHTATLLQDRRVLVAGGNGPQEGTSRNHTEIYTPSTKEWTPSEDLLTRRRDHTATLLSDGSVLVAGGFDEWDPLNSAELYLP